jgi:hypothetical protein
MTTIAKDIIYRARVNALRDICIGGPVTVRDAGTGKIKTVIKHPLAWEDIVIDDRYLNTRINLRHFARK